MRWGGAAKAELARLMVNCRATILDALQTLEQGGQSISFVSDDTGRVIGSLTDGDIRRALLRGAPLDSACLTLIMCETFTAVTPETSRAEALDIMHARSIGQLPVLDAERRLIGLHTIGQLLSPQARDNSVVVLAGGRGTRLHPITHSVPKPMLPVAGRPILERIVLHLMSCGFRKIYLSVNHLAHVIEEHFGSGERFGCDINYLRESEPLGTGGPLALLDPRPDQPLLVLNGDLVTQCNFGDIVDFHTRGNYAATLAVKPYSLEIPFGVAAIENDQLVRLEEKPIERRLVNTGIYVLSPAVLGFIPGGRVFPITDLFGRCLDERRAVGAYVLDDEWIDIGRQDELRRARGEE